MFKNYLKTAVRNLWKHKLFSFIGILGIAVGIASSIFVIFWIRDEISYDNFHKDKDAIYFVLSESRDKNTSVWTPAPLAPVLKQEIPEVQQTARLQPFGNCVFHYGGKNCYEQSGLFVDPSFFDIFTFPLVEGSARSALSGPNDIILSEKLSKKYFGDEDPIGKSIRITERGDALYTVKGVAKDILHSDLQFDFAILLQTSREARWDDFNFLTFVKIAKNRYENDIKNKIDLVTNGHQRRKIAETDMRTYPLLPLSKLHLMNPSDASQIYILSVITGFILLIASFNFINLSTAKGKARAREIGIRKTIGATRSQLIMQFFVEFLIYLFLALILSLLLIELLMPNFNALTGKALALNLWNVRFWVNLLFVVVITGFMAGLYPAVVLSAAKPVSIIKNAISPSGRKCRSRKILVVAQFAISILLIVCTTFVFKQFRYLMEKSWNLNDDQIVWLPPDKAIGSRYEAVKEALLRHPRIKSVSAKDSLPTQSSNHTSGIWWEGKTEDQTFSIGTAAVDDEYFRTMNLDILEGRNFSGKFPSDPAHAFILSEEAVKQMRIANPIGKRIRYYKKEGMIIGVVRNSFYQSLKDILEPQLYSYAGKWQETQASGILIIRIDGSKSKIPMPAVISHIETVMKKFNPSTPFEYHFLNESIETQYAGEKQLLKFAKVFSLLAIFLSSLGLFGLAAFITESRTKEIGVRKILGASTAGIIHLLNLKFIKWVLAANVLAWPVAYDMTRRWLHNFAYPVDITIWPFVLAGISALVIALLTVSGQAIRAATANPADSLRHE